MRALVLGFTFSALLAASAFTCGPGGTKQDSAAREAEDKAMLILGFRKLYMACGPGSFMWVPKDFGVARPAA